MHTPLFSDAKLILKWQQQLHLTVPLKRQLVKR